MGGKPFIYYQNLKVLVQNKTKYTTENEGKVLCVYCMFYDIVSNFGKKKKNKKNKYWLSCQGGGGDMIFFLL